MYPAPPEHPDTVHSTNKCLFVEPAFVALQLAVSRDERMQGVASPTLHHASPYAAAFVRHLAPVWRYILRSDNLHKHLIVYANTHASAQMVKVNICAYFNHISTSYFNQT